MKKRKKEILIYDDENRLVRDYIKRLNGLKAVTENFVVRQMTNQQFGTEIDLLKKRQRGTTKTLSGESLLDTTQVFIVEYDLFNAPGGKDLLTGERVSYLARCFSRCDFIIGVNQFGENPFDLTLRGHPESYADLNVGADQLDNPGLWSDQKKAFRPWYWPVIPRYLKSYEERVRDAEDHLNEPISRILGLEGVMKSIPRSALRYLGKIPSKLTFREFVLKSGNGLKRKDKKMEDHVIAKIAAARIAKWLERLVLPGQDVLVDAPHLVYRYPSLLHDAEANCLNIAAWNRTAAFDIRETAAIDYHKISDFKFEKSQWLTRDAWNWNGVSSYQKIEEVSSPWKREEVDFRFCEDISSFRRRKDCAEFVIDSDSPYNIRFLRKKRFPEVDYVPIVNLLG